jgi:hypothetical protein
MKEASPGDTIVVTRLDRLARSTRDLLNLLDRLGKDNIGFKSLRETSVDTTSPQGRLVVKFLHHDPVALDFVQIKLDRAAASADATSGASTVPRISPLARSRTTRQRRFIRPASLAGLSFLLVRRGSMAKI